MCPARPQVTSHAAHDFPGVFAWHYGRGMRIKKAARGAAFLAIWRVGLFDDFHSFVAANFDEETVLGVGYAHALEVVVYGGCDVVGFDVGDA